jgi:hypothetical protein
MPAWAVGTSILAANNTVLCETCLIRPYSLNGQVAPPC